MRSGAISDAMWELYTSRVLQPGDERLKREPFLRAPHNYIVHRHSLRATQSLQNAKDEARRLNRRLYIALAADAPKDGDRDVFTDSVRLDMLRRFNPRYNKYLPGVLPLYVGMRLLLYAKDCVRFGLMNGCLCELVAITFSEHEELPPQAVGGHAIPLQFMPVSLLLRVPDVAWALPSSMLPVLPPGVTCPRGLFQLRPRSEHLRHSPEKDRWIDVRRTQFPVLPADSRVVYAAQGETFDTVIADMRRPPNMDRETHWLACYVMLSRTRSIDGLLILRPAERTDLSRKPPQKLIDEIKRLEKLEISSTKRLWQHLQSLPWAIPDCVRALFTEVRSSRQPRQCSAASTQQPASSRAPDSAQSRTEQKRPMPEPLAGGRVTVPRRLSVKSKPLGAHGPEPEPKRLRSADGPAGGGAPDNVGRQSHAADVPERRAAADVSPVVPPTGCSSCGQLGHADSSDPLCPFHGRARELHPDAAPGDNVPHMGQVDVQVFADGVLQPPGERDPLWYTGRGDVRVVVANRSFTLGYASGNDNNCLIYSLRDLLRVMCDVALVRSRLEELHPAIMPGAFLSLEYWEDIVNLLWRNNEVRPFMNDVAHRYQLFCAELTWIGHGVLLPLGALGQDQRQVLYIARVNTNHFIPLIRDL